MSKKLNNVLLIDDDLTINYYHNKLIEKSEITNHIAISKNGKDGLESLLQLNDTKEDKEMTLDNLKSELNTENNIILPELMFLDLNMPIMNGWEFLEKLSQIKNKIKIHYKIYILSATVNPDDRKMAKDNGLVSGFLSKPLTKENLELIRLKYLH